MKRNPLRLLSPRVVRNLVFLAGIACVTIGVAGYSWQMSLMVLGVALLVMSTLGMVLTRPR